jgi:hypothetical protein
VNAEKIKQPKTPTILDTNSKAYPFISATAACP